MFVLVSFPPGRVVEVGGGGNPVFQLNVDSRPVKGRVKVVASKTRLPFRDSCFSGVYLSGVWGEDPAAVAAEAHRILRPFGVAVGFLRAGVREVEEAFRSAGFGHVLAYPHPDIDGAVVVDAVKFPRDTRGGVR